MVGWSQGSGNCTWTGEAETAHLGHKEGWMDADTHTSMVAGVSCASLSRVKESGGLGSWAGRLGTCSAQPQDPHFIFAVGLLQSFSAGHRHCKRDGRGWGGKGYHGEEENRLGIVGWLGWCQQANIFRCNIKANLRFYHYRVWRRGAGGCHFNHTATQMYKENVAALFCITDLLLSPNLLPLGMHVGWWVQEWIF